MAIQVSSSKKNLYETIRIIDYLDLDDLSTALDIFTDYSKKGIILNKNFEDNTWMLTDEYQRVGLDFTIKELDLKRSSLFKAITCIDFSNYLRMYVVRLLGSYVALHIQTFIRELKEVIISFDGKHLKSVLQFQDSNLIYEFIEMINLNNSREYDCLLRLLELESEKNIYNNRGYRRQLTNFQSYFKFNDIIDDFWGTELTNIQKIFYFPLYLWWHITTILPLRPREFLLIPRDCFRDENNPNTLTIRRTNLKGSKKNVTYSVANDYTLYHYNIGVRLSEQIKQYIYLTDEFEPNELNTLFRTDIHYNYFGQNKRYNSRLYTYANMRYCLNRFYTEIIQGLYKHNIISSVNNHNRKNISQDTFGLKQNEIEIINLGDTRHIAMINIVASGGTPTTAMLLAGHTNIDISSHYFSNISTLIECKTYQNYMKSIDETKTQYILNVNPEFSFMASDKYTNISDGGKCYSNYYYQGDYQDCLKSIGENGEVGDCDNCTFHRSGNYRLFVNDKDIYMNRISDDCDFLADQLNLYRQAKGYEEDVKQAILRLHSSSKSYEKYFISSLLQGGK